MANLQDFERIEPSDRREQLLSWLTPGRKLAIVGGLTLLPALGLGLALNGLFAPGAARPAESPRLPSATSPPQRPSTANEPREVDRLKAELALAEQRHLFEKLPPPRPLARPAPEGRPAPPAPLPPPRIPLPAAPPAPILPPAPPPVSRSLASLPDLQRLAYLGSSREVGAQNREVPEAAGRPSRANPPSSIQPSTTALADPGIPVYQATSLDPDLESAVHREHVGVQVEVRRPTHPTIPPATLASGVLERPILFEQSARPGEGNEAERFLVVLTEAVTGDSGAVLLPVGTRVLVSVSRISTNGLVTMQAVALHFEGREVALRAVPVRGAGGLPLQAASRDRGGEVASLDLGQAVLKGAEEGLAILNRPTGTSQGVGLGGNVTSSVYGAPNPLAAVGSGLFGELARSVRQHNQQALRRLQERPELWMLPAGTAVELLFTHEVRL